MEPKYNPNVESEESSQSIAWSWFSSILYCGFCFPSFYYAVTVWKEPVAILISGFFAAFGVVYLVGTIWQALGQRKFGTVRFLMERPAPSIGGTLRGSITVPEAAMRAPALVAELSCDKETFAGKDNSGTETLWCGKRSFPIRRKPGGGSAEVAIDIPANLQPSTARPATVTWSSGEPPKVFYIWRLRVTVDLPGVDLDRNYLIVVLSAQPHAVAAAAAAAQKIQDALPRPFAADSPPKPRPTMAAAWKQTAQASAPVEEVTAESQERDSSSVWVLVAANLVAIAGAVFWGWAVEDIVFLYWIENLVIGAYNLPRIMLAEPDQTENAKRGIEMTPAEMIAGKAMFAAFFLVHYGGFCLAHGEILVNMFPGHDHGGGLFQTVAAVLHEKGMWLAVLAIVFSRGFSFFRNYLGRREYDGIDVKELMFRPYKRIFVMHLFILFGGFVLDAVKLPVAALVVFIAVKIGADAYYHRAEREALAPRRA